MNEQHTSNEDLMDKIEESHPIVKAAGDNDFQSIEENLKSSDLNEEIIYEAIVKNLERNDPSVLIVAALLNSTAVPKEWSGEHNINYKLVDSLKLFEFVELLYNSNQNIPKYINMNPLLIEALEKKDSNLKTDFILKIFKERKIPIEEGSVIGVLKKVYGAEALKKLDENGLLSESLKEEVISYLIKDEDLGSIGLERLEQLKDILKQNFTSKKADLAFKFGNFKALKFLINQGVIIKELMVKKIIREGVLGIVETLIEKDYSFNEESVDWACNLGHAAIVKLLVEKHFHPSELGIKLAIKNGHVEIVKFILDSGIGLNEEHIKKAFSGDSKVLKLLLETTIIETTDPRLLQALKKAPFETQKVIVENITGTLLETALGHAIENPNFSELLIYLYQKYPKSKRSFHTSETLLKEEQVQNLCETGRIKEISIILEDAIIEGYDLTNIFSESFTVGFKYRENWLLNIYINRKETHLKKPFAGHKGFTGNVFKTFAPEMWQNFKEVNRFKDTFENRKLAILNPIFFPNREKNSSIADFAKNSIFDLNLLKLILQFVCFKGNQGFLYRDVIKDQKKCPEVILDALADEQFYIRVLSELIYPNLDIITPEFFKEISGQNIVEAAVVFTTKGIDIRISESDFQKFLKEREVYQYGRVCQHGIVNHNGRVYHNGRLCQLSEDDIKLNRVEYLLQYDRYIKGSVSNGVPILRAIESYFAPTDQIAIIKNKQYYEELQREITNLDLQIDCISYALLRQMGHDDCFESQKKLSGMLKGKDDSESAYWGNLASGIDLNVENVFEDEKGENKAPVKRKKRNISEVSDNIYGEASRQPKRPLTEEDRNKQKTSIANELVNSTNIISTLNKYKDSAINQLIKDGFINEANLKTLYNKLIYAGFEQAATSSNSTENFIKLTFKDHEIKFTDEQIGTINQKSGLADVQCEQVELKEQIKSTQAF